MSYELTATVQDGVLIATLTGSRNLESTVAAAREIKDLCEEHGVDKALIDVQGFEGSLGNFDAFFLVTKHFALLRDFRVLRKAAILDRNLSSHRPRFLENAAVNRGYNFRVFDDQRKALKWLM